MIDATPYILIVDGEPAHAEAVMRAFESAGATAEFQVVGTRAQYRHAVAVRPPNIALMELNLPDGGALETLTCPPEDGPFPIVIMTSHGNEWIAAQAIKAGAVDYIPKSAEAFANMPHAVHRALDHWEMLLRAKWSEQELVESERSLQRSVEHWQTTFDGIADAVCLIKPDATVTQCNAAMANLAGRPAGQCAGRTCCELIHGSKLHVKGCPFTRACQSHHRETGEFHIGDKWFNVTVDPLRAQNGGFAGAVHIVADITERKRAREELLERETRYRELVQNANSAIIRWSRDGNISFFNEYAQRLFGYSADEAVGRPVSILVPPSESTGGDLSTLVQDIIGDPERYENNINENICRDGRRIWMAWTNKPVLDAQGRVVEILCVGLDITERKLAQDRVELSARMLAILNRANDLDAVIGDILVLFKKCLGFGAVGIRLRQKDDFPYFVQNGFPDNFVRQENHLCSYDKAGRPVLDADGKPVLECMCGNVLSGRTDPGKPFFTEGGSFWTNSTTDLLASTCEKDRQAISRNRCNSEGYESMALIPLRSDNGIIGLLQLNDRRRDMLSPSLVQFLEGLGQSIAIAVKRQQAAQSLQESEERFRTLVESITDYTYKVTIRDGKAVETAHGPGCLAVTGYSPEEFSAAPDLWFQMVHPDDQPSVFDWSAKLSSGRKAGPLEHRIIHKNGQTRWVGNSAVPRHDSRGQYVGYEGLIQDVTEYHNLQDRFAQAQKMEAIGQLAGGVAHDFRNQLAVIIGYAEMLMRRGLVDDDGRAKLKHILDAADRSTRITGQLLSFSRQQMLRPEVVDVNLVTADMMKSLAHTIGEDIKLSIVPCGNLWRVRLDTGQFQQALLNLVLNARDAMPQGGQLTIETVNIVLDDDFALQHAGASAGRHVVLSVSDTGCGMSPETRARIFEPFFTTKAVGDGTGLGLAMVHGFVIQSGGAIDVQSRPGKSAELGKAAKGAQGSAVPGGTTFRLYFPAVDDVAESAELPKRAQDLPRGSGAILVVEDEAEIKRMLLDTLGECGYTVLTAGDAKGAMALIESVQNTIDLLITDVVMPGWSGPELARHFHAARPGVPVLMISGHTGKMLTEHGVVPAEVNLLIKPFSAQALVETVRRILSPPE